MPIPDVFLLGHSPDPDDAFMFYAMAEHKIDLRGYRFQHILQEIQTLNERALRGELHLSAVSIHAFAHLADKYALLPCGASMGDGYGPMLVARDLSGLAPDADDNAKRTWLRQRRIAAPGAMTSAFLALQLFLGNSATVFHLPFDQIFHAVTTGTADVGLLIHEGQLTYATEGFSLILDLGEWWKRTTGLPLPLGGNVIRRDIPPDVRGDVCEILRESIRYGLAHRAEAVAHSMPLARGLDRPLADKFIGMYVNDYTLDYGDMGRTAVRAFLEAAYEQGLVPGPVAIEFVS